MKHLRWIIPILIVAMLVLGFRFFVLGTFIEPQDAIGLSQSEARDQFGEPDWIPNDDGNGNADWVYYHGLRGSSLEFSEGVVVDVHHRTR